MTESIENGIIPENDDQRLDALYRYKILNTPPEESFNNIARLMADTFNVPIALISLVDKDKVFFKGNTGMPGVQYTDRNISLCSYAILSSEPTVFENALEEPCLLSNPLVHGNFGLRFYAGAPLTTSEGYHIGTVCILDKKERTFSPDQQEMLVRFSRVVMHDIELRQVAIKQAAIEQELIEKERKFRSVIDNAPVAIVVLRGEDMVIETVNQDMLELLGKTAEITGKPLLRVLPEIKGQLAFNILNDVYRTGKPYYGYEVLVPLIRNGVMEARYFNFAYTAVIENGQIVGITIVATEVTETVLSRRKLEESEEKYRRLFESMDQGLCILELIFDNEHKPVDCRYLEVNPVFEKQSGVRNAVGKTMNELIPNLEPFWTEIYGKVALTGEPTRFENYAAPLSKWFDVYAFRIDAPEEYHVAVMFRDVTVERQAVDRLQKVLSIETVGVIYFDLEGGIHDANKAFERMSGFSKQDLVSGKVRWDELTPPEFMEVTLKSRDEFLAKWQNTPYEKQYIRPDGSRWWGLFAGKRLSENECVEFVVDITENKQAEALLEQRVKERTHELELRNKELEQFTFVSSHDLQEPLRKILIFTDMVKKDGYEGLPEVSKMRLEKVAAAARRMSTVLRDILDFASLSKEEQFTNVNLKEVLIAVRSDLELVISEKEAKIISSSLPTIKAVPGQMHQLFYNLVNNALKFSKTDQQPVINITCKRLNASELIVHPELNQENQYYEIGVQDNGIGFSQDLADKIFMMFQRLHSKETYDGTGIGLALCKKVVVNHGGKIWAEGQDGEGATFKVLLPAL